MKILVALPLLCAACGAPAASQAVPPQPVISLPPVSFPIHHKESHKVPTDAEVLSSAKKLQDAVHQLQNTVDSPPASQKAK